MYQFADRFLRNEPLVRIAPSEVDDYRSVAAKKLLMYEGKFIVLKQA